MQYICEFDDCRRPAVTEWQTVDDEEQEAYTTLRCAKHPVTDPDYEPKPITNEPDTCALCGASPMTANCNNAGCI